ncbi:MAG: hypothetical protein Kow0042_25170 [Calditrichia bacterium]
MKFKDSEKLIQKFLRDTRLFWQIIFLISILAYGLTFIHHLNTRAIPPYISHFRTIDLASFALALILALSIFRFKRKYFRIRFMRTFMEEYHHSHPEADESLVIKRLLRFMTSKLKIVWVMGAALILLGVIFYWYSYTTKNLHVYFIVGLYSLIMNYPRKELFGDLPYFVWEIVKGLEEEE